jgi:hypothetical protein
MKARGYFERALAIDADSVEALIGMAGVDASIASDYFRTTEPHDSWRPRPLRPGRCL